MNRYTLAAACLGLVAIETAASAHDYWLAPSRTRAPKGAAIDVRLYRGEPLLKDDERPLEIEKTGRFALLAGGGVEDLLGSATEGQVPVVRVTPKVDGGNLVVMERKAQPNRLEAGKFTAYLKEEGLESIVARREQLGESMADGRELYSRYLKALIQVGDGRDETFGKVVGLTLEIVPEADPSTRKVGDPLPIRVLFEGKPLAGAQVIADAGDGAEPHRQTSTTDGEGRASFQYDRGGFWLIRLVHMRRAAPGSEADWESFWGAYTFGL